MPCLFKILNTIPHELNIMYFLLIQLIIQINNNKIKVNTSCLAQAVGDGGKNSRFPNEYC